MSETADEDHVNNQNKEQNSPVISFKMTSTKTHKIHKIYPYVLLVDRPNGWRVSAPEELLKSDFLLSQNVNPTEFVPKGTLVEFDPLCFPMSKFN